MRLQSRSATRRFSDMLDFSLFLNTRGRPKFLLNFLSSVWVNTKFKDKIEVIVNYDDDDEETHLIANYQFNLNVKFIKGPRPQSLHTSINEMSRLSIGENLFVCNDDIQIVTQDWDEIALNKIQKYKNSHNIEDDIYYCRTFCNSADRDVFKSYCSFPIISKKATEILGFFMYEEFKTLGGDSSIYKVYDQIDRVIDLTEVKIDHIFHNTIQAVVNPDKTAAEYRQKYFENYIDPHSFDVSREVQKLKNYIDANKKH